MGSLMPMGSRLPPPPRTAAPRGRGKPQGETPGLELAVRCRVDVSSLLENHPPLRSAARAVAFALLLGLPLAACSKSEELPIEQRDGDNDAIPDLSEDRNQNGVVDPGETDPTAVDTDLDGVPDEVEVSTLACSKVNDRPFEVYDVPGADSMVLVDARVRERSTLRTLDNRAPGAALVDPELDVASVIVSKQPAPGVASPSAQRDFEKRNVISQIGRIMGERTRALTTVQGFAAEEASFTIQTNTDQSARAVASLLATNFLNGVQLTGLPQPGGVAGRAMVINLLTIYRSQNRVVLVAAVALGSPPTDDQLIRLEELTDGTNVARHGSFTRHVCDPFEAKELSALDIIWVVDDSGSMEDDQQAVRDAANAMADVLGSGGVDFRLGVTRTRAQDQSARNRGQLEGSGFTADLNQFKRTIVVGAEGGWEPGLETGIRAYDLLLPKTPETAAPDPRKLREGAATVVVHLSDERDQIVECAACGGCPPGENEPRGVSRQEFCTDPSAQSVIDRFIGQYAQRSIVSFAIVGDLPNGCQQTTTRDDFEPGQGYVEVANATGGHFGSLCGDMRQNVADIARAATGIVSAYELSHSPASASIRVALGPPAQGRPIPRSRTNGFDYDPVGNRVIFYGDARPRKGDEIVIGYRRWDWANNPSSPTNPDNPASPVYPNGPADGCHLCEAFTSCDPELDTVLCVPVCGEVVCAPGLACLPDSATCGDPSEVPQTPTDACGGSCDAGLVCNASTGGCVLPCEQTGCRNGQICSGITHLCQVPNF